MHIPALAIAGAGAGLSALSGLLGGNNSPELPEWFISMLRDQIAETRATNYVPDRGAYMRAAQSQVNEIMAGLPVSMDAFNADLAARGIYSSGEAPSAMYRDVIAPVSRSAMSTMANAQLGYENLASNVALQRSQLLNQLYGTLGGALTPQRSGMENVMGTLGDLGDFGAQFGTLKALGLI